MTVSSNILLKLEPLPWQEGLVGDFPGQESFIELGDTDVPMDFCWCPPTPQGQPFQIGSPSDEREVSIPEGYWLAKHPVNQRQWQAVMGRNPSLQGKGPLYPVDSVSWHDAREFCQEVGLRLPSEVEWEYACRAGTTTLFAIGSGQSLNAQMANFEGNYPDGNDREAFKWIYRKKTILQGSFPPNDWGFHDMHGQLWEWCEDEYAGGLRALRGGGWFRIGVDARSGDRSGSAPDDRLDDCGFRPCPSSIKGQVSAGGRHRAAEWGKE